MRDFYKKKSTRGNFAETCEKYISTAVFEFSITPLPYVRSLRKLQHMMAHGARIKIIMKKKN